jgi:hypothetical protein
MARGRRRSGAWLKVAGVAAIVVVAYDLAKGKLGGSKGTTL